LAEREKLFQLARRREIVMKGGKVEPAGEGQRR
jgi:hypothetical protein